MGFRLTRQGTAVLSVTIHMGVLEVVVSYPSHEQRSLLHSMPCVVPHKKLPHFHGPHQSDHPSEKALSKVLFVSGAQIGLL